MWTRKVGLDGGGKLRRAGPSVPSIVRAVAGRLLNRLLWSVAQTEQQLYGDLREPVVMQDDCAVMDEPFQRAERRLYDDLATAFRLLPVPDCRQLSAASAAAILGRYETQGSGRAGNGWHARRDDSRLKAGGPPVSGQNRRGSCRRCHTRVSRDSSPPLSVATVMTLGCVGGRFVRGAAAWRKLSSGLPAAGRDGPHMYHERPERPAILARLEAAGRLSPAKNPGYVPQRLHPVTGGDPNPLTRALLEDRESER